MEDVGQGVGGLDDLHPGRREGLFGEYSRSEQRVGKRLREGVDPHQAADQRGQHRVGAEVLGEQAGVELDPVHRAVELLAAAFCTRGSPEIWSKAVTRGKPQSSR